MCTSSSAHFVLESITESFPFGKIQIEKCLSNFDFDFENVPTQWLTRCERMSYRENSISSSVFSFPWGYLSIQQQCYFILFEFPKISSYNSYKVIRNITNGKINMWEGLCWKWLIFSLYYFRALYVQRALYFAYFVWQKKTFRIHTQSLH